MLPALVVVLVLGSIALAAYAQRSVQGSVARYRAIPARSGMSGREVAEYLLRSAQLDEVSVERSSGGELSDHYDPRTRVLRLSEQVYDGRDLAAIGIAAHEAGHALQHAAGYWPLNLRSMSVPIARLGGLVGLPLALIGLGMRSIPLTGLGLGLFATIVLFQLITLPVELDASRRAVASLRGTGLLETEEEEMGVRSVLSSAAMTYLAAAATSIAGLAQILLRVFARRI
ncbi:MAG: zinc metallopeptidase [Planctomycetes bacterium]|nr:zinc metallopeptidase [Planctomycetota bacterium]